MKRPRTRLATLYRLAAGVDASREGMFDAFTQYVGVHELDERRAEVEFIDIAGMPAVWVGIQEEDEVAEWCADASATTGLNLAYTDCGCSGVLLLGIDGVAYAMSYGGGHRLIPKELLDDRFGLSFLIRRLNSDEVQGLVRRRPNARGRTDSTLVAAGAPVWTLNIAESVEIIRKIGGHAKDFKVTFSAGSDRTVNVEGSVGLRMRFGVEPDALVADIREVERVCRDEQPNPALEFIEHIQPVNDATTKKELDGELDKLLAGTAASVGDRLIPVAPTSVLDSYSQAHSFTVRIGYERVVPASSLELEDFLRQTRSRRDGDRVNALRGGRVYLNADDGGEDVLDHARADQWFEANVSIEARRFFLMDGDWFEIGADYVRASHEAIVRLFPVTPSITLPPWSLAVNRTEYEYNSFVAARSCGQYLCLDRNVSVRNPLGARSTLEICDLLGPRNELIHVKRAEGSMPLSHLFSQGYVSAQSLVAGPSSVLQRFTETVAGLPHGRTLDPAFRPTKVVYAILLDNGKQLSPTTLFPFSQATLAQAARLLGSYGIEVEVIGIPHA